MYCLLRGRRVQHPYGIISRVVHILLNAFWAHNMTGKGEVMQSLPYLMNLAFPFLIFLTEKTAQNY